MKRVFAVLVCLFLATGLSWADRASKKPYQYTQPDGSVITLVNHGDEFHHWTTYNGRLVEQDERGFYRPASQMVFDSREAAGKERRRQVNESRRAAAGSGIAFGEKHFLVLLIEFDDLSFSIPNPREAFDRMLNQPGYSENAATGSVRDYYIDNSAGQFTPVYDVYGPVRVSGKYSYYGSGNDDHAYEALEEACQILDDTIDFSQYDLDKDGYVDNVFFYFAGYNEKEGGGTNTIWPHQSYRNAGDYDNVRVFKYACTSELSGYTGTTMAAIGIFVHEFAHVLGVPDFYDTSGDIAANPEDFSVMSSGNYLNSCRTPANLNSVERQMLGWVGEFPRLSEAGSYELQSLSSHHLPWVLPADVEGEQFILEMRDGTGWDAYLPKGMVIYHMDVSDNIVYGTRTAASLWDGGVSARINDYDEHPCFYVVASLEYGRGKNDTMIFPGTGNVTELTPIPWSGLALPTRITDITVVGDRVCFNLSADVLRMMRGTVKDTKGNPIEGATVTLSIPTRTSAPGRSIVMSRQAAADIRYATTTLADGSFEIILEKGDQTPAFFVSVSRAGYIEQAKEQKMGSISGICSFFLRPAGSPSRAGLMRYDPDSQTPFSTMGWHDPGKNSIMAAIYFSAEELKPYAGMEVRSLTFCVNADKGASIHGLVCDRNGCLSAIKAGGMDADGYVTVDLAESAIKISGEKGLYFGYAVDGDDPTPVVYQFFGGVDYGLFYSEYDLVQPDWIYEMNNALILSVTLYDPAASQYISLSNMGFTAIDNPRWKEGYSAGDTFTFRLLEAKDATIQSTEWLYDGTKTTNPSVKLSAGKHVVTARIHYHDGSQEELTLELNVR